MYLCKVLNSKYLNCEQRDLCLLFLVNVLIMFVSDCGPLATLTDGSVSLSSGTTFGSVATFSCDTGYTLNGDSTRTCLANSLWDKAQPTCQINGKYAETTVG